MKHQIGPWLFAAALDAGYDALNTTRYIGFAGVQAATSTPSVWRLDSRFRAAYVAEFGNAYVKPSLDLDVIYTALPGFSEAGAGPLGLNVASCQQGGFCGFAHGRIGADLVARQRFGVAAVYSGRRNLAVQQYLEPQLDFRGRARGCCTIHDADFTSTNVVEGLGRHRHFRRGSGYRDWICASNIKGGLDPATTTRPAW